MKDAAVALGNTLTGWVFLIFGGSILLVLGTSYYRPQNRWVRWSYLIYVPGWLCLAVSAYQGTQVQSVYLASLFWASPDWTQLNHTLNRHLASQIDFLRYGLVCFGLWLFIYLLWWIFAREVKGVDK